MDSGMEYTMLGASGLRVSRVAFGCAPIGGYDYGKVDDRASVASIRRALELGVNLFDVADVYGFGHAEEVLGRALQDAGARDVIVATKVGVRWDASGATWRDLSAAWISRAVEDSLRRLRLDRIPLYQMHWPDPAMPLAETMEMLERLRLTGKIANVGACNFDSALLRAASAHGTIVTNQLPFSLADPLHAETIHASLCERGMSTLAYNVLAHGLFSGKYGPHAAFEGTDLRRRSPLFHTDRLPANLRIVERLRQVGARHGRTPAQVAIRWSLQQHGVGVALTGVKRVAQIEENVGGCGWSLSPDECDELARPEQIENPNTPETA